MLEVPNILGHNCQAIRNSMTAFMPTTGKSRDRVRARILLPFAFVILFVIGTFLMAAYMFEQREHERTLNERAVSVERLFRRGLENDAATMEAALMVIARDVVLKKVYLSGNRENLLKLAGPLFDELRRNNRVTHFYFTRPNRVNFLRVHKPDEYGDTIDRITTLRAAEAHAPARGIELGPLGTFTLRVVLPWYDGETLIGFLELGEEIDHIIDEVHRTLGADLLVLVNKRFLSLEQWKIGKKLLGHDNDWPRFGKAVVVGRAMEKIPDELILVLKSDNRSYGEALHMTQDGRDLYTTLFPLEDIASRVIGDFIVVRDVTGAQAGYRRGMIWAAAFSVLVGGIVFIIFYVILGTVERDYRRQRDVELQLSRINTEYQKVIQLEKLSAMGLMISEIAHQLNNPLVGVINMAQLAERNADNPEHIRELLSEIGRAGKDCHNFVKRMLEFNKISCFDRKPTDMNRLVEETVALFLQSIGNHRTVLTNLPDDSAILDVDPVLVEHALFNLLTNAVQANPSGGTVTISLYPETRKTDNAPGWCLAVRDEGHGLSDDVKSKIFTPFFTTRSDGTGLGLPIVQHIALIHDGWIAGENATDGGAIFTLWFPESETVL